MVCFEKNYTCSEIIIIELNTFLSQKIIIKFVKILLSIKIKYL